MPSTGRRQGPDFDIVTAIRDTLIRALQNGDYIKVYGFGTFKIVTRPAHRRWVRNIYNNKIIETSHYMDVPEKRLVRFYPSPSLKEFVNEQTLT